METLKNVLKTQRIAANLSQKELANKAKITQPYYSDIERGRYDPRLKVFSRIAAILDIDMNNLKEKEFDNSWGLKLERN